MKRVVLITGGNSGIGLGLVKYLIEKDYEVVTVSRSEDSIKRAKKELGKLSNKILFLQGDVSNIADCEKIYSVIDEKYKRLDGLVNSAGITTSGGIEEESIEDWNKTLNTNLTGIFIITKTLLPLLKKGENPAVVNISSISSIRVGSSISYCVSKAGVDMLTHCLGKELGKYNIRVNAINPGEVYSNLNIVNGRYTKEEYDEKMKQRAKTYPLGKIGDPFQDLAPTIEFLLSDKSLWTTGATYVIDGGKSL